MGNYDFRPVGGGGKDDFVRFIQSRSDFPLTVRLGRKTPRWSLNRWAGDPGLVFAPMDDEGYRVRGDGKRYEYRGRRRSHRFTILHDGAFEYDCILNSEPETNRITLLMDGAEGYDFFRQPDFVKDPMLAGSYAVYKKTPLLGEGTGKLCHINRPEIMDAKGRRCLGELAVEGNRLEIIVPEGFLSGAAYPVVVDPVVGTTTAGSQHYFFNQWDEDYQMLNLHYAMATNRFTLPETLNGRATAFVYAALPFGYGRCIPLFYADEGGIPVTRLTANEGDIDFEVGAGKPAGWRSATLDVMAPIAAGGNVWMTLFCDLFAPAFDFGAKCYWHHWFFTHEDIPDVYPMYAPEYYYDFKLSMYFTYTVPRNYQRTLINGVTLGDSGKHATGFRRMAFNDVGIVSRNGMLANYNKNICNGIIANDSKTRRINHARTMRDIGGVMDIVTFVITYIRAIVEYSKLYCQIISGRIFTRMVLERIKAYGGIGRKLTVVARIIDKISLRDFLAGRLFMRKTEVTIKSRITETLFLDSRIK